MIVGINLALSFYKCWQLPRFPAKIPKICQECDRRNVVAAPFI
jgi:hypothetical protein